MIFQVFGDIHGRDSWKAELGIVPVDRVVFIGDYLDSFHIQPRVQQQNLLDLISLKRANGDNVILLLGNHDLHYIHNDMSIRGDGFNAGAFLRNREILLDNADCFDVAYCYGNTLFTHAGALLEANWSAHATSTWLRMKYWFNPSELFGSDGPFWVRPDRLVATTLPFNQVFGHTEHTRPTLYRSASGYDLLCVDDHSSTILNL